MRRPPEFWRYHCTSSAEVEKWHHRVELAPSWRLRAGGLCATSIPLTPDEKERNSHRWGSQSSCKTRKVHPQPHKGRKSAGLVSSFPSFNKREAAHSFRFPCGAAPTHRKPGQTKAPAQCPLAFSWLFALLLENIHKIHSKPWVVSVMICLDGSVPATNQLSQQTLLSWHSVTGSPTLGLNWTKNRLKRGESGGKRWHSMFYT